MYSFDSYLALKNALSSEETKEYAALRDEQINHGAVYQKTLSAFSSGEIKLAVPQIDGAEVLLRNAEGFSNITLLTCELYGLPWIWYHCSVGDSEVDIKISYLNSVEGVAFSSDDSFEDILNVIAPGAPSPENYKQFASYRSVYRHHLSLFEGTVVSAIVLEMKDSANMYVMFRYGGVLVSVYGDEEALSDGLWASFGIRFE